jgi:hypothetical protein
MEPEGSLLHSQALPIRTLSQTFAVPASPSDFFKIHFNIIFPSTPGSSKQSLSLRFPHQNLSSATYVLHTPPISFFWIWSPE